MNDRSDTGVQPADAGKAQGQVTPRSRVNSGDQRSHKHRQSSVPRRLLSMKQAGEYLGVSYWTVRTWVENGTLTAVRLPGGGKLTRIELAELERLVERCREN